MRKLILILFLIFMIFTQTYTMDFGNIDVIGSFTPSAVIGAQYGGTGNGFTKFTGPTTEERVFTLPDASATMLYSNGALGTPSGGTLTNCTFPTLNQNTTGKADTSGNADTVTTITGLAPDTENTYARTQYLINYAGSTSSNSQIPIGTDGQVLTSNGAGSVASFQDAAGGDTAVYGEIYLNTGTIAVGNNNINTWFEINGLIAGESTEVSIADSDITISTGGRYLINYSISSKNTGNNQHTEVAISIDDSIQYKSISQSGVPTTSSYYQQGCTCILNLAVSDVVKLEIRNVTGTGAITVIYADLNVLKIGS